MKPIANAKFKLSTAALNNESLEIALQWCDGWSLIIACVFKQNGTWDKRIEGARLVVGLADHFDGLSPEQHDRIENGIRNKDVETLANYKFNLEIDAFFPDREDFAVILKDMVAVTPEAESIRQAAEAFWTARLHFAELIG